MLLLFYMKSLLLITIFILLSFSLFSQETTTNEAKPETVATVGALIGFPFNTPNNSNIDTKIEYWRFIQFGIYSNISVPLPKEMSPINILVDFLVSGTSLQFSFGLGGTIVKETASHGVGLYTTNGGGFNRGSENNIDTFKTGLGLYYHLEIQNGFSFILKTGLEVNYIYITSVGVNSSNETIVDFNPLPVIYFGFGKRV